MSNYKEREQEKDQATARGYRDGLDGREKEAPYADLFPLTGIVNMVAGVFGDESGPHQDRVNESYEDAFQKGAEDRRKRP